MDLTLGQSGNFLDYLAIWLAIYAGFGIGVEMAVARQFILAVKVIAQPEIRVLPEDPWILFGRRMEKHCRTGLGVWFVLAIVGATYLGYLNRYSDSISGSSQLHDWIDPWITGVVLTGFLKQGLLLWALTLFWIRRTNRWVILVGIVPPCALFIHIITGIIPSLLALNSPIPSVLVNLINLCVTYSIVRFYWRSCKARGSVWFRFSEDPRMATGT